MKQAALKTFHKKFLYWLERDKKQIEEKIQNEKKLKEFQDHKHFQKLKKIESRRQFVGEEIKNVKNYGKIFSDKVKFKPVNIKRIKQKYPQVKEIKTDGTLIDFYPKEPEDVIY
jgi:shikimate kinase